MSKSLKHRKPSDDVDRVGLEVLKLFADGAQHVTVVRKGKPGDFHYDCWAVTKRKLKARS